jgi:hypothetical protein
MGVTNFQLKNYLDSLSHTEINTIYSAINNIEAAITIVPGTGEILLYDSHLDSMDASKLIATSDASIRRMTLSETLDVTGNVTIGGVLSFGTDGGIKVRGANDVEIVKIGSYGTNLYGLIGTDGTNVNFLIDNSGDVTVRGVINALTGSQFVGTINAQGGTITGDVSVGGSTGLILKGSTKELVVAASGKIVAGSNELTSSGFSFNQGTINIGTKFSVDATGKLTATDVDVSGRIVVSSGNFEVYSGIMGGAVIGAHGIYSGGFGSATTGWSLDKDGFLHAKKATVTGTVNITSGTITGDVTLSDPGRLILPGVTFSSTGPSFSSLNLSLGGGRFNLNNGYLICTGAIVTGQFNMTSGNVVGTVTIGGDQNLKFDGVSKQIVAGNSLLKSSGITFKQGTICLGTGVYGPAGDESYRTYLSNDGYLVAQDVYLEGSFVGSLTGTSGTIGGWFIDSNNIFAENTSDSYPTGVSGEINRSFFILSNGALSTYSDRSAIALGHSDVLSLRIDKDGLYVPDGAVNISIGVNDTSKVIINSTGIRAQETLSDEVVIDSGGIKSFKNGADLGYIITPNGLEPSALKDHSLTTIKFNNIAPKSPTNLTASAELVPMYGDDKVTAIVKWSLPTKKSDESDYTDPQGFKIYFKESLTTVGYPCIVFTDHRPDFPEIIDPEDPNYNTKSYHFTDLDPGKLYIVGVSSVDRLGNESPIEEIAISTPLDQHSPIGVLGSYFNVKSLPGIIIGSWPTSTEKDFLYYEVERAEAIDGVNYSNWQAFSTTTSGVFADSEVYLASWYKYRVRAVDRNNHQSEWTEMLEGLRPLEITSDLLADDITIIGNFGLNTPHIEINGYEEFLAIYGLEESTPTTPATPVTPDDSTPVTPDDTTPVTPVTPVDATPLIRVPRGLAARNLFVGEHYDDWYDVFSTDATPTVLDYDAGNAYFAGDVYILGNVKSSNIDLIDFRIDSLQIDTSIIHGQIDTINTDISSLELTVLSVQDNISSIESNIVTLQSNTVTLQADVGTLQSNVGTLQSDVSTLKSDRDQLLIDVDALELIVNGLQSDMSNAQDNIIDTQSDVSVLQLGLDNLQLDVTPLQVDVPLIRQELDSHLLDSSAHYRMFIDREVELVGAGGIPSNADHVIPDGKEYLPGSNNLLIFLDGRAMLPNEYTEVSNTTIRFLVDIPQASYITYMIFQI